MDSPTPRPKTEADLEPATVPEVEVSNEATEGDLALNEIPPVVLRNSRRPSALGDFQLVERIGAGAMSVVYSARQVSKDRPAAVKVLRPHLAADPLFLQRFLREADVMARLRHPNIVRCYSVGKQYGYHYIAMELIEGHTLGDWIVKIGRLSLGDVIHVTLACARALQHAHQNGLIHRDVKPDNLLITREGHIKLIDLGLARPMLEVDVTTTQEGHGAGTPVYVAPEQARDARDADPRSDLYSLGCVFYQMLTGQQAFRGDKALDIILAKINGQYIPPRRLIPDLPEDVETVLASLLAPHPDERYQSATDLVRELEAMQMASPVLSFLGSSADVPDPSDSESPALTENDLTPTAADAPLRSEKRWFVLSRSVNGDWITRRYTTSQILHSLKHDSEFARSAQASLFRDAFRPLIEYPEFHDAVLLHEPHQDSLHHPHREGKSLLVLIALLAGAVTLGFALAWMLLRT